MKIFDILLVPMGYLMRFAAYITGNNYLFAIVLFALIMEILMLPIQIKQQKNSIRQAELQPKIRAITKKYDGRKDAASMQEKQMKIQELYQKENFSPFGGCLPLLIQLPIIFALYSVIINPLRYICGIASDKITAIRGVINQIDVDAGKFKTVEEAAKKVISEIDLIGRLKDPAVLEQCKSKVEGLELSVDQLPNFKLFDMLDLSATPTLDVTKQNAWLLAIPVLVFLGMFFSQKLMRRFTYQPPESADMQNGASMKIMNVAMPLMSAWIAFKVPAAVGCYWFIRNIISVVEKWIISKAMPIPVLSEEEFKAAEREYGVKAKHVKKERDPNAPRPRSLHTIDFDDEPLPPPVPDKEPEEEETEKTAKNDSPVSPAPLKDDKSEKNN